MDAPLSEPFAGLGPAGEALLSIGGQDMGVSYAEVREAMDDWAHELSDMQRESADRRMVHGFPAHEAAHDMANLIDPKVTQ